MFKKKANKEKELVKNITAIWENDHGEVVSDAYNEIVEIMSKLDTYSANMIMNLVWLQTVKKTYESTVGKKEMGGEKQ